MDSQAWIQELARMRDAGRACVLVTVVGAQGSTPREAGARMLVDEAGLAWGTIGGGRLEHAALEEARSILRDPEATPRSTPYPLSERVGQCCGGQVTLFFEPFRWGRHTLAVFGAGHVGQALAGLAPWLDADVRVIDERAEAELEPSPPAADARPWQLVITDDAEAEMDELPPDALVVVMTHDHALDQRLIEHALRRHDFPYLGLIGSTRKWQRFRARLGKRDLSEADLARVTCPIGLGRTSKEPAAIALSVAAQVREILDGRPVPGSGSRAGGSTPSE